MAMRDLILPRKPFGLRKDKRGGWEVFERMTGKSVVCDGKKMAGLSLDEADLVMDILNGDDPLHHVVTVH